MFIACPHCRYLVATDPRGQHAPTRCPRCGGVLGDSGQTAASLRTAGERDPGPSLARLLRRDEDSVEPAPAASDPAGSAAIASAGAGPAGAVPSASPPPETSPVAAEPTATVAAMHAIEASATDGDGDSAHGSSAPEPAPPPETDADRIGAPAQAAPAVPVVAKAAAREPSFLHGHAHARPSAARAPRWQWAVLGVLALALVLQVLLADRARLAGDAAWRPALTTLCDALGCSLPPWREPQAFAMLDRDVRPVPEVPGVLQAQATFRNDARWPQPWPVLMLTLKDADGRTLGARALRPSEYLPRDGAASATLGPGQSAQVAVRVREPSANVVAFSFDFR